MSSTPTLERGRPPTQPRPRHRLRLTAAWASVLAVLLAAILTTGATTSWHFGFGGDAGVSSAIPRGSFGQRAPASAPAGLRREFADNRNGSPVFASAAGSPAPGDLSRLPFNTPVDVKCFAPNTSGMASVSGFYLIGDTKWHGLYVVADTMSNGGAPGNTTSPNVDPNVQRCH